VGEEGRGKDERAGRDVHPVKITAEGCHKK